MTPRHMTPRMALITMTLMAYAAVFSLAAVTGLRIDYGSIAAALAFFTLVGVPFSLYCGYRRIPSLQGLVETVFCGLALTIPVLISTYLAIKAGRPLADPLLAAMDAALGFDWHGFIRLVDARPGLAYALGLAYQSFMVQLVAIPMLLCLLGKPDRAYRMIVAYGLLCLASSTISIWFPAEGTYKTYAVAAGDLANLNIKYGYFFLDQFNAVRSDPNFTFSLQRAAGILTFPSVHAAVAFLCAWAAYDIRLLRYPAILLNAAMATAAVSNANHYLVDVVAGVAVAACSIAVVVAITGGWRVRAGAEAFPVLARDGG